MSYDLEALFSRLGLTAIRPTEREVWASCPAHHDSGDSWSANRETGIHNCFACGYAGDLQSLICDIEAVSLWDAGNILSRYGFGTIEDESTLIELRDRPKRTSIPTVWTRYHSYSLPPPEAIASRQISLASAEHFGLRWDSSQDAWILPIRTPGSLLIGYQIKSPTSVRTRPPGVPAAQTVFGAEHLRDRDRCIVVESPLDAVRLHTLGYYDDNLVATFGAGISDAQMRLIIGYSASVTLALDNDDAGREGTARIATGGHYDMRHRYRHDRPRWMARLPIDVIAYPPGPYKDIGDMPENLIDDALASPINIFDWLSTAKRLNDLESDALSVPGERRRANGKREVRAPSPRNGPRKNTL